MMARQGNDKTEYQRRIARGLARGLSPSQARGHPKVGEAYARAGVKLPLYDRDLETGLRAVRDGKSLKAAAKSAHVSQERLRNYMVKSGVVEKRKGRWTVGQDDRKRETLMYSRGQPLKITVAGYERNADIGVYMDTVKKFLETGEANVLDPFKGKSVQDVNGKSYPYETDPNLLYRIGLLDGPTFEQVYVITA